MKIFLATWLEDNQGQTLTKTGCNNRLLSYYFLKDAPKGFLDKYSKTGTGTDEKVFNGKIKNKKGGKH